MHFALFILVTSHTIAFTCKMELLVLDLLCLQLVQGGRAVGGGRLCQKIFSLNIYPEKSKCFLWI